METKEYMSVKEAAEYLGLSRRSLDSWRFRNRGPIYSRLGDRIVYRRSDLDAWVEKHAVKTETEE